MEVSIGMLVCRSSFTSLGLPSKCHTYWSGMELLPRMKERKVVHQVLLVWGEPASVGPDIIADGRSLLDMLLVGERVCRTEFGKNLLQSIHRNVDR